MFELRFFEIYRASVYVELLLDGVLVTGGLSLGAGAAGFLVAIIFAMVRYWHVPVLRNIAASYVEFIRNTPLIVQLFFFAFGFFFDLFDAPDFFVLVFCRSQSS